VFFLDSVKAGLIRVEYHEGRAVVGRDLTQQGGPDLDPQAEGVFVFVAPNDETSMLGAQVADCLDAVLSTPVLPWSDVPAG
jgi:hypothetical protein